ncbi:hypothetical protein [Phaeovulum vinaykumarii]|uniref:Uncharacterized protein n=1 Tax=Phaeovulum vinaykumarii TaxID=407234 RepID=A0A1N7MXF5_9RHOB|nr:hypothetical protein [Phaeovulum vinaykumarii]SIS90807.1 hypothetical protein SAMN05421795_11133 [Phaeovulum vinaykumarii]SOC16054.1 hypothetical protein SAMN05878426_11030 [Phaeovulum vinaykumarii]
MTPQEAVQARQIIGLIVPSIPRNFSNWISVAAWLWLSPDGKGGGGGQAYDTLGDATGFTFPIPPLLRPLSILREMHPEVDHRRWQSVLLQFGRSREHVRLAYAYDDPLRWMITEGNYASMIRAIRPDFAGLSGPGGGADDLDTRWLQQ